MWVRTLGALTLIQSTYFSIENWIPDPPECGSGLLGLSELGSATVGRRAGPCGPAVETVVNEELGRVR